jgi:hypothetical protein
MYPSPSRCARSTVPACENVSSTRPSLLPPALLSMATRTPAPHTTIPSAIHTRIFVAQNFHTSAYHETPQPSAHTPRVSATTRYALLQSQPNSKFDNPPVVRIIERLGHHSALVQRWPKLIPTACIIVTGANRRFRGIASDDHQLHSLAKIIRQCFHSVSILS